MNTNENYEKQFTLNDYLRIFQRGKWIILISFIIVVGFVVYYTFTATPIYQATAKVMFKENKAAEQTLFNITSLGEKTTLINNQVQILHSRTLAERVIQRLKNSAKADKLEILGNAQQKSNRLNLVTKLKSFFLNNNKEESTYSWMEKEQLKFQMAVSDLQNRITVNPIRNTDVVELSITATSPFEAAYITNTLAEVYKRENQLDNQAEVRKVKDFLSEQLDIIQNQLMESEVALKNYMEEEKVVALPEETQELVTKAAEFESLYRATELEIGSTRERLVYVNEQLDKSKLNFNTESLLANPFIEEIKKQMAELETRKATYIATLINEDVYSEDDPRIQGFDEKIRMLSDKLKSRVAKLASSEIGDPLAFSEDLFGRKIELEAQMQSLQPRRDALKKIVDDYNIMLESIPSKSLRLARLERAAKLDEKITLMMKEKYEESRITEVGQLGNVRIIDPANPPLSPIKPKKKMNLLLGIIVGLGLGVGITFMLEYFDNSIHYMEEIERMKIPALGSIPLIKAEMAISRHGKNGKFNTNGNQNGAHEFRSRLITHFAPKSPISESYRSLRTNIQFARPDKELKTILVTSPGPQEGKSTTIANLAIAMAQMGSRVLLVDTDLRRPIMHSIFGISRSVGLTNHLVGRVPLEEAYFETDVENIFVMPSGTLPPNPSELLSSKAMTELIEVLKGEFDYIFFDCPPVIAVTDATVLSAKVDGIIMVVKSGQTDRRAIERSYATLSNVCGDKILGVLLNVVNMEGSYGGYYYYYYHTYYGNKPKKTRKSLLNISSIFS